MLDVDQNYGTPETPKPFPTFKECVAQDVQNVIFNSNEFAEERYIDDKLMLCITQHPGVLERPAHWEGGAKQSFDQGMYKADLLLFVKQKDYGPMPKSGKQINLGQETDLQHQIMLPESGYVSHGTGKGEVSWHTSIPTMTLPT